MVKNFYRTVASLPSYALAPWIFLGGHFLLILVFRHFSGVTEVEFLLEKYWYFYIPVSFCGVIFNFRMHVLFFVWWRFLAGLCFMFLYISVLLEMAYFSGWPFISYSMLVLLFLYSLFFLLRFVFWSDFHRTLLWYRKIENKHGEDIFYLTKDGYMEVHELNDKLKFLKFTAFWEIDFFAKPVDLTSKTLNGFYKFFGLVVALGAIYAAFTDFNVVSAGIIIVFSLIIPEFLRHSVGSAFLDAILVSKYKIGDRVVFPKK
ncbi:hypothetical protein EOE67_08005 [Rheinheimera riviphila]|uniref:Uncharacterized protein n=1 Tax=Rheinheimera riviphila TaxID=1834037 RepID=A0A437R088_9GAMM|nr:hypothetical protein [Rheinheimera riviphila]RVU40182.1 hypothetical protein EOE67_08005 [Rheinheimera riviphila]